MHFSVGVITEGLPDFSQLEDMLAPFQENNMGTCPEEYLEFFEEDIEQYREDYETDVFTKYKLRDGSFVDILDESIDTHRGAIKTEITAKELYPNYNDYLLSEIRLNFDQEKQKFGYWANPDAEWDWYSFGGRWAGYLKFKKDSKNCFRFFEESSNKEKIKINSPMDCIRADYGLIKDLIVEPSAEDKRQSALEWELKVENRLPRNESEKKILKELQYCSSNYLKSNYKTKENYVKKSKHLCTYAIITKDGNWFTIDDDVDEFTEQVIKNAGDNDYISIVDCHI